MQVGKERAPFQKCKRPVYADFQRKTPANRELYWKRIFSSVYMGLNGGSLFQP